MIQFETMDRVATHLENLEKSLNSKVVREKSGKMEKGRGSEIRYAYNAPPDPLVFWGGGHPIPFSQLLQPQLLNN